MPYLKVSGDTMNGPLKAQNNANHTTPQARNMVLVAAGEEAPETGDGDVILMYAPMLEMIEFYIGDTDLYSAEQGMTWGEWIDSEYNTIGFTTYTDGGITYVGEEGRKGFNALYESGGSEDYVTSSTTILANKHYYAVTII